MVSIANWKGRVKGQLFDHPVFAEVLDDGKIEEASREAGHRWRRSFWSPPMTVITFLLQVLDGAKTLRSAVGALLTQLAARGETVLPSCDPTAYCQGRRRLPFEVFGRLLTATADRLTELVDPPRRWLGRRVWVVDGSSCSMPDTEELQEAFPQPGGQKKGCGFPIAQFVAVFCWATGAICDLVIDTIVPHELTLFRRLWDRFQPGDVVLADRAYGSFVDMTRLLQQGVFCVFRLHQRRRHDFRKGRRLGPNDRLVTWERPRQWLKSFGIGEAEFEQLPQRLTVRVIRITHVPRGFRSRTILVVTTLLDPLAFPAEEIGTLYRDRWTAELNLRSLKTALGMDVLRAHSEDVVRKEIAMHLVAYNLIRLLMWQAARDHARDLHRLSFAGTLHRLRQVMPLCIAQPDLAGTLTRWLLLWVAHDIVPHRPNRCEPRRRKRRPKEYSLLQYPRAYYHLHGDPHAR